MEPASHPDLIGEIVAARPEVAAVALGGSRAGDMAGPESDYDVYVFVDRDIPLKVREALARRSDPSPEIGNTWFGPGDEWTNAAMGTSIDVMYWRRSDFERDLRDVIERHRPSLGYSTAFWYTVRQATPLFDRDGWFAGLQALAARPYPEALQRAIVGWNHPLLRMTHSSWRRQIELAIARGDPVSVNHRVAALLASAIDIIFALHQALHPGEKRLLAHIAALDGAARRGYEPRIRAVLEATAHPAQDHLLDRVDDLCDADIGEGGL